MVHLQKEEIGIFPINKWLFPFYPGVYVASELFLIHVLNVNPIWALFEYMLMEDIINCVFLTYFLAVLYTN